MSRSILNFGAGPTMLPEQIMLQAQAEFMDWQSTGKSVIVLMTLERLLIMLNNLYEIS